MQVDNTESSNIRKDESFAEALPVSSRLLEDVFSTIRSSADSDRQKTASGRNDGPAQSSISRPPEDNLHSILPELELHETSSKKAFSRYGDFEPGKKPWSFDLNEILGFPRANPSGGAARFDAAPPTDSSAQRPADGARKSGADSPRETEKEKLQPAGPTAESLARGQEATARAWNTSGYGSEAITARLVKEGLRAQGKEDSKDNLDKSADDSRNRRLFKEFGRNSCDLIDTLKTDKRFEMVPNGALQESKLKRGDIVVWPRDQRHPYGLSKVYLGDGKFASDHVSSVESDLRGMGRTSPCVFRLRENTVPDNKSQENRETGSQPRPPQPEPPVDERQGKPPVDDRQAKPPVDDRQQGGDLLSKPSSRLSNDTSSPDYYRFKNKDGSITDLREIAKSGFPREWNHYDNAPGSGFAAVKDRICEVAKGKGEWNAEMQKRYQELKGDPRMHYCMMVDGKVVGESKDAKQAQEGASTTKAIVFAARHVLADQQGKTLSGEQYKEEMATLAYSLNQLVRPVQKECSTDLRADPTGTKSIMQVMDTLGISENSKPTWGPNKLAPRDGASFMQKVMTNGFAGADQLKTMMEMCKYGDNKMVMTAPRGVAVAHKTGTYNGNNDLGGCVVRGADGKDHVVSFCAQTKLNSRDIGILFGGLLRENGLSGASDNSADRSSDSNPDRSSRHYNDRDLRARENAQIVSRVASELGVDPVTAVAAMLVESGGNPRAVGDNGTSFGLFQLHKGGELDDNIYKRSLTKDEAFDPEMNARVALSVFKANQGKYKDPGVLAARSQRPADQEGYAAMVNANLSTARRLLAPIDSQSTDSSRSKNTDRTAPAADTTLKPKDKSALSQRLQKYYEELGSMDRIDKNHPFKMDSLKATCRYDQLFQEGKDNFKKMQEEGKAPSLQQLFEQAKAASPAGQRYFEASVPYWVANDGREAVGQNFMWDEKGNLLSENYWRRGGGDQLGHGKTVTIYHNIEGITAGGSDVGWINQSTNESVIARGGNPPVDMHGRSMSSGTSAGCEAHPSDKGYQNWLNFRDKMHLAILDNQARGLRPFASLHVGFDYAIRRGL
jgi:hypothetical protein